MSPHSCVAMEIRSCSLFHSLCNWHWCFRHQASLLLDVFIQRVRDSLRLGAVPEDTRTRGHEDTDQTGPGFLRVGTAVFLHLKWPPCLFISVCLKSSRDESGLSGFRLGPGPLQSVLVLLAVRCNSPIMGEVNVRERRLTSRWSRQRVVAHVRSSNRRDSRRNVDRDLLK